MNSSVKFKVGDKVKFNKEYIDSRSKLNDLNEFIQYLIKNNYEGIIKEVITSKLYKVDDYVVNLESIELDYNKFIKGEK